MTEALREEFPLYADALKYIHGFWYLATPYAKWVKGHQDAFVTASKVAGRLLGMKVPIFSPIAHAHPLSIYAPQVEHLKHQDWMDFDKVFVDASHGTIVADMDGWRDSKGVLMEINWTLKAKKPLWVLDIAEFTIRPLSRQIGA